MYNSNNYVKKVMIFRYISQTDSYNYKFSSSENYEWTNFFLSNGTSRDKTKLIWEDKYGECGYLVSMMKY